MTTGGVKRWNVVNREHADASLLNRPNTSPTPQSQAMFSNPEAPKQIPSTQSLKEALEYPILPKAFADHDLPSIPSSKVIEMNGDSGGRLCKTPASHAKD